MERRPGVFAFAHLTFQEFLAAQAIHEGNLLGMGPDILAPGHADPRWQEVVVLFCGLSTASSALAALRDLMESANSDSLGAVLADAYRAAEGRIGTDQGLRARILDRIARSPNSWGNNGLEQFPEDEVAPIANRWLGTMPDAERLSSAFGWLRNRPNRIDEQVHLDKLADWRKIEARPLSELVFLLHLHGDIDPLLALWDYAALCQSDGPSTAHQHYGCQAEIALMGLSEREPLEGDAVVALLPPLLLTAASKLDRHSESSHDLERLFRRPEWTSLSPADVRPVAPLLADAVPKLIRRLREIGERLGSDRPAATKAPRHRGDTTPAIEALESWLALIQSIACGETPPANQTGAQA